MMSNTKSQFYKAKSLETHQWVEGYLFETKDNSYIAYAGQFDDDLFLSPQNIFIPVDSETVCQPTDVFDKSGKELYTNDVISGLFHGRMPINGIVQFQNGSFGLQWHRETDFDMIEEFTPFSSMCNVELEVLGNKFDNPELLEQKFLQPTLSR